MWMVLIDLLGILARADRLSVWQTAKECAANAATTDLFPTYEMSQMGRQRECKGLMELLSLNKPTREIEKTIKE